MDILNPENLNAPSALPALAFASTAALVGNQPQAHAWVAQASAKQAALHGLRMPQAGFNVLVLGEQGSGRTSLILSAMRETAQQQGGGLLDLVALCNFDQATQPILLKLPVGEGAKLRAAMEQFCRHLIAEMPKLVAYKTRAEMLAAAKAWLQINIKATAEALASQHAALPNYFVLLEQEIVGFLSAWQPPPEGENPLETMLNEALFARMRVNVLVDMQPTQLQGLKQPVVIESDPSLVSLFGTVESAADSSVNPEFMRLRAGNLHKADGGMLLLHLRDLLSDEANGVQIIEKLQRFLRNGTLQIEDLSSQNGSAAPANTLLPAKVKLVLIATREDFYDCLDQNPDFFEYFPIKVEFAERISANVENYAAIAGFVAQKCVQHGVPHFSADGVAALINAMQRAEEDQGRISTSFALLEHLMLESAAFCSDTVVNADHVKAALQAKAARNAYFEAQIRDSIIDNELMIQVHGEVVGQVNGLTHIELGDASFGSPIRITARCYPGPKGLINIDREVNMSGPNHDKGIFILHNWLSASFSELAPLSLNASLVFEQEYNGVEGDSASCAELFALLSALAGLPVSQGIAITGALNQFGEVMPVGGINEKIEGYFRVCQALGLDGKQGVMIPKRNQRHLLLDSAVVDAVKAGKFKIIAIEHVLDGIAFLTQNSADTVIAKAAATLADYRKTLESNQPKRTA